MFNFKELFALVGLLIVIGIVGILYRTVMERPTNIAGNGQILCSQDTRTCASGVVQKRTEPGCAFAVCPQTQPATTTTATSTATTTADGVTTSAGNAITPATTRAHH